MSVYVNNLIINAGEDFSKDITLETSLDEVVNLAGYAISSYIRKHTDSSNIIAGFGVTIPNSLEGKVVLSLGSSITSLMPEGRYVYDVLATNNLGKKSIIVEGMINVRTGVSS